MKKVKMMAIVVSSMLLMTACASEVDAEVKEQIETPVAETPVEEEAVVEKVSMDDYIVPEMDLSVTTDELSELSEDELEKGLALGDAILEFFTLNAKDGDKIGEGTRLTLEKLSPHMTERLNKLMEEALVDEIAETEDDEDWDIIEEREDGSVVRIDDTNSTVEELIGYITEESHILYMREFKYDVKEYADKDTEEGTVVRAETKPYFLWLKVEDGEIKMDGYGFGDGYSARYLNEEQMVKYDLGAPRVLEKPKYDNADNIEAVGGWYWGEEKEEWYENEIGAALRAIYPNLSDGTTTYVFTVYNNTETKVSGKYGLIVSDLSYAYKEVGKEEVIVDFDRKDVKWDIVELNLEPGETLLYDFVVQDKDWYREVKKWNREEEDSNIENFYFSNGVGIQKLK